MITFPSVLSPAYNQPPCPGHKYENTWGQECLIKQAVSSMTNATMTTN